MRKTHKILLILIIIFILFNTNVFAHGGNITGWKKQDSDKIIEHNGKNYGYHNQNGERHYHEVEWNTQNQRWNIVYSAICYDENFNVINNVNNQENEKIEVKFAKKVDGDTAKFELDGEIITVRFLGIDTPETVHPTKGEEPFGKEASDFTEEKLQNATKIELEYESNSSKTDKYERHLAWVWVDDVLVQEELVKRGLAKTYMLQDNYKYAGTLQKAEKEAEVQKIGIWSDENSSNDDNTEEINEQNAYDEINHEENITQTQETDITLEKIICFAVLFGVGLVFKFIKKK